MTWNFLKRFRRLPPPTQDEICRKLNFDPPSHEGVISSVEAAKALALGNTPVGGPVGAIGRTGNPAAPPITFAQPTPDAMLSISSPDGVDSIVIEANAKTIMEAWDTKEAMVDRPVGTLGFAAGVAYIMTRDGWVNMGEALEKPLEMTDRRGAIRAQKERNRG